MFHEVTDAPSPFHRQHGSYLTEDGFRKRLEWISRRFTVVTPPSLEQLGGTGVLPPNAALITFDDAWSGTFDVALPILRELGLSALWFLNLATVRGDPDFAAVRGYERSASDGVGFGEMSSIDRRLGARITAQIRDRYATDPDFLAYQGQTATAYNLTSAAQTGSAWFASHLYHHWDIRAITDDLYAESLARNAAELEQYPNSLPAFATPHGYAGTGGRDLWSIAAGHGVQLLFTGQGHQNESTAGPVLDRVFLPSDPSSPRAWWHATHLARLIGPRSGA